MTYALSTSLQRAVFAALAADPEVASLSDGQIFDAVPPGPVPSLHVRLGPERVRDRSDNVGAGAVHDFAVIVVSDRAGFQEGKSLAGAVSDALMGGDLTLDAGKVVNLSFRRARARWLAANREIELWFRAHLDAEQ